MASPASIMAALTDRVARADDFKWKIPEAHKWALSEGKDAVLTKQKSLVWTSNKN